MHTYICTTTAPTTKNLGFWSLVRTYSALCVSIVAGALFCIMAPQAHALTLSGTVYEGVAAQPVTGTYAVQIAIGTSTVSLHSTTTTPTGAWSFEIPGGHTIGTATPMVVWIDGDASFRASVFTKASSTVNDIVNLNLYHNRAIVRSEATSTTIANLSFYDEDDDSDIRYGANSGTLSVRAGTELFVYQNSVFAPEGAVTLNGNAGTSTDGSLYIAGTYVPSGTTTIAGNFIASTSATHYLAPQGLVFNATTTGKYIKVSHADPLGNLAFTGVGGAWYFASDNATVTNMTIGQYATVTAPLATLTVKGTLTQNGAFKNNSGTLISKGNSAMFTGALTGTNALASVTLQGGLAQSTIVARDTTETAIDSVVIDEVNGVLYAGSNTGGIIYRCVLSSGCDETGDFATAYATSQSYILAMTIDTTSNVLYVATGFDGVIYRCALSTGCDASGDFTTAADTTEFWMYSITIDQVNGVLYTGTGNGGIIYRCALSTNCDATADFTTAYDTSEGEIQSLVVDQTNGVLYAGSGTGGIIYRCVTSTGCDASGDFTTAYDTTTSYIYALGIDAQNGVLYVGTGNGGIILRCVLSTGCDASGDYTTAYDTTEQVIYEFAFDTIRDILYVGSGSTNGLLYQCFLNTACDTSGDFTTATDTTQFAFYSVVVHQQTGTVYGGAYPGGIIYRYTPGSTDSLTLGSNTKLTNLSIGSNATVTAPSELTVGGTFTNTGSFAAGTSTVFLTGARNTVTGSMIATSSFNNVTIGGPQRFGTTSTSSLFGAVINDPTASNDVAYATWGDDAALYVTGACDGCGNRGFWAYHTIAYRKSDGSFLWSTTTDPTISDDVPSAIQGDDMAIYVTGFCDECGNRGGFAYHTIAYRKSDGSFLWSTTTDPTTGWDEANGIWGDDTALYVTGRCNGCGNQGGYAYHTIAYRKSDGSFLWSTTTDRAIDWDEANGIWGDGTALYITGSCDGCGSPTIAYRKSDGAFLWSSADVGSLLDIAYATWGDDTALYVTGECPECGSDDSSAYYTVKYDKRTGAIINGENTATFGGNASTTGNFYIQNGGAMATNTVIAPTSLTIAGNYTNYDTFVHASGTVTMSSSSAQMFAGNTATSSPFANLVIDGVGPKSFADRFTIATDTAALEIQSLVIDTLNNIIYAGSYNSGIIYRCVLSTGCDSTGDFTIATDTPESSISSLLIDRSNSVMYGGTSNSGIIYRCVLSTGCDSAGDFTVATDTPASTINSLVIDTTNSVLYAGSGGGGIIYRCVLSTDCDSAGDFTVATDTPASNILSLTIDTTNSVLYAGSGIGGIIYRCVLSTDCDSVGDFTVATDTPETSVNSLTIDTTNSVLYAGSGSGGIIYRCVLSTGCDSVGDFTTAYDTPTSGIYSLTIDSLNKTLYAGSGNGGIVYSCVLSTDCDSANDFTTATDTPASNILSLTIDTTNSVLYAGSSSGGIIYRCALSNSCISSSVYLTVKNLTVNTGGTIQMATVSTIAGDYTNNGTSSSARATMYAFNGGVAQVLSGTMVGTSSFPASTTFTGAGMKTLSNSASTTDVTIDADAQVQILSPLTIGRNLSQNGALTLSSSITVGGNLMQGGTLTNSLGSINFSGFGTYATGTFTNTNALGNVSVVQGVGVDVFTVATDTPAAAILSLIVDTANSVLYAGSSSGGIIYRCALSTGCDSVGDFTTATDTPESAIYSLVIDTVNGTLYAGSGIGGIIYRCVLSTDCDSAGDFTVATDTPASNILSLTIDTTNGTLYAGSGSGGIIYRCALSTGCDSAGDFTTAYDTSESSINSLIVDAVSGTLYAGSANNGIIYRCVLSTGCDASGDFATVYDTVMTRITSLIIDARNGVLYAGSYSFGFVFRCVLSTGCDAAGDFLPGVTLPGGTDASSFAIDDANGILYAGSDTGGIVYRCLLNLDCVASTNFTVATDTPDTSISSLTIDPVSGTLFAGSGTNGNIYRRAGGPIFTTPASTTNLTIEAGRSMVAPTQLSISGNYTNSGTFIHNNGTTTFTGTSPQTIAGIATGTSAFNGLVLQGAGTKTFINGASTTNLYIETTATTSFSAPLSASGTVQAITPGAKIALPASATSTVAYLTITGTAGNEVKLRSTTPGTQAGLSITGTTTITYADVKDSSGTSTSGLIYAGDGTSINSGNNTNWLFLEVAGNATISSGANQTFALNYPTTTISTITITDALTPGITAANDLRIVIATSSVNMRWDTTDTTATFGGTAAGKVSNPVSYEGNGSILVIPVDSNFSGSDTLTISDLSFTQFAAINAATTTLGVRAAGVGSTTAARDDKYVTVTGSLTLSEHGQSQVSDSFLASSDTQVELYRYIMAPSGESMTASTTVFTLTGVNGVNQEDLSNLQLYKDNNANGTYEAGDLQVGGAGVLAISGQTGTITFSTPYSATTSYNYLLIGDVASIRPGDQLTVSLAPEDIEAGGLVSLGTVPPVGSASRIQHIKGGMGSSGSALGGDAPAGQGVRIGGEQGGGSDVDTDTGGDTLGNEPGFRAPTANEGSWATGGSGYNSDAAYATADSGVTHTYSTFGFSVPSNNTITGIEVKIEGAGSTAAGSIQAELSWDNGNTYTSAQTTGTLTATDAVYTLGSPSDTWGHSWTPSEAEGAFTLRVTAVPSGNTVKIDAIRVNINHQATGGGQGGGAEVRRHTDQYFALLPGAGMVAGASIEHKNQYETLVTTLDNLTTLLLKMRSEIKP